MDVKNYNIFGVSICFLFLFTAFQSQGGISQRVLDSYHNETLKENSTKVFENVDGYLSFGILYLFFAAFNWVSPIVISFIGSKYSMLLGAIPYALYVVSYIKPNAVVVILASMLLGIGAATLWTAQGVFLTENSCDKTIQRNSGIFWSFLQSAMIWGNLYVYYTWKGITTIDSPLRIKTFTVFSIISGIGVALFLFLRQSPKKDSNEVEELKKDLAKKEETPTEQCKRVFMEAIALFVTKNMLYICITFAYSGIHQSFWTGVYPAMIGQTKTFGDDSDRLIGMNGITMGAGQVVGGLIFSIFPKYFEKILTRERIVVIGGVTHIIAFVLAFGNFAATSPYESTHNAGGFFEEPNYKVSLIVAFLLGFGDCCFNTQIFAYLGWYYKANSAPAFAIFKSVQSVTCAISFFYARKFSLVIQLVILLIGCVVSVFTYLALGKIARAEKVEEK